METSLSRNFKDSILITINYRKVVRWFKGGGVLRVYILEKNCSQLLYIQIYSLAIIITFDFLLRYHPEVRYTDIK